MVAKLFLHIGTPKTGTTFLQAFFARNADLLLEQGVLYPRVGRRSEEDAHHLVPLAYEEDAADRDVHGGRGEFVDRLAIEFRETKANRGILSTEAMFGMRDVSTLRKDLAAFDVEVIVFLRRQDEYLESAYTEAIKDRRVNCTISEFVDMRISTGICDYASVLDRWSAEIGDAKIHVMPYENAASLVSIIDTVAPLIGFRFNEGFQVPQSMNDRPNRNVVRFIRAIPTFSPQLVSFFRAGCFERYSKAHPDPEGCQYALSPQARLNVVDSFRASNAEVARRFLAGDGDLFTAPEPDPNDAWTPDSGLTLIVAFKVTLSVIAWHLFEWWRNDRKSWLRRKSLRRLLPSRASR